MKRKHRATVFCTPENREPLEKVGLFLDTGIHNLVYYDSDPYWPTVRTLFAQLGIEVYPDIEFEESDMNEAQCFRMAGLWYYSYPQPMDLDRYRMNTYVPEDLCLSCGVHGSQVNPFKIVRAPRLTKKHIFALNWVWDELFVERKFFENVLLQFGVKQRPVVDKKGEVVESIVQLDIDRYVPLYLQENHVASYCDGCKRTKYKPFTAQYIAYPKQETDVHLFKSEQFFGYWHAANQVIIVSRALYETLATYTAENLLFQPCKSQYWDLNERT